MSANSAYHHSTTALLHLRHPSLRPQMLERKSTQCLNQPWTQGQQQQQHQHNFLHLTPRQSQQMSSSSKDESTTAFYYQQLP
jgi:hypothetical protein